MSSDVPFADFFPEHFLFLMIKVVPQKYYLSVAICQIDDVRICVNWSGENIVNITFLYIMCKNMLLGSIDTKLQTVTKHSAKCI